MPQSEIVVLRVPANAGARSAWGEWMILLETSAQTVVLDLTELELQFADPLLLARMRAFIDWHCSTGKKVKIVSPRSNDMRLYLERMHLARDLPPDCDCDLDTIAPDERSDVLIPIRRLASLTDGEALEQELGDLYLAHFTGKLARLAEAFTSTVSEVSDNATTHGRSEVGVSYVAAQRYGRQCCILAIGDLGIGIPGHLRRKHAFEDDGDAIRIATKEGITGTGKPERGFGYQWVIDSIKDEHIGRAELRVWTAKGRFRLETRSGLQARRRAWAVDDETVGTWVRLELEG